MAQAQPVVINDLDLLERIFLRIGSASTDSQLEKELDKYLAPIIQKLATPEQNVKNKIMEILRHVNRRVKDMNHIQLPVEGLLLQYQNPTADTFVTNFAIIYIKMGFKRLDLNQQVNLLPTLINCLEQKNAHQDNLLQMLIPVLGDVKIPETPEKTASLFNLRERPKITKVLVDYIQDMLLLPYGAVPLPPPNQRHEPMDEGPVPGAPPVPGIPACMNIQAYKNVCSERRNPEDLEKLKLSLVKFLSAEVMTISSIVTPLIIASSDTRFSVANAAELSLKRLESSVDWDCSNIIASLYILYLGTLTPIDRTPKEKFRNPANTRIRLKLMPYLTKSKEACNHGVLALRVFCECVWGETSNVRLKQHGVKFLNHISLNAKKERISSVADVLFSRVVKLMEEEKNDHKLRSMAYVSFARLSVKLPELLLSHTSQLFYIQTLMDALIKEEGDVLLSVQEALSLVAPVCRQLRPESQDQLCILLTEHVTHHNEQLRRMAVQYASSVFNADHVPSRFILMLASGDMQDELRLEAKRQLYKPAKEEKDGTQRFQSPPFSLMATYVLERVYSLSKAKWVYVANNPLPYPFTVCEQILHYLEHCLSVEATQDKFSSSDQLFWKNPAAVAKLLHQIKDKTVACEDGKNRSIINQYLGFVELVATAWSARALESILRIVAVLPNVVHSNYSTRLDWIKKYIMRGGQYGEAAAHLFGVILGHISDTKEFENALEQVLNIKDMRTESQESCILAQTYSLSYKLYSLKMSNSLQDNWLLHQSVIIYLIGQLCTENNPLQMCVLTAVGEIARYSPLNIENDESLKLTNKLIELFKKKKVSSKIRELAIKDCGLLCVGDSYFVHKLSIMESLLSLAKETTELEIHFAVGEALADCILGHESSSANNPWIASEETTLKSVPVQAMESDEKEKDIDESMEKDEKPSSNKLEKEEPMEIDETAPCGDKGSLDWLLQELLQKYVTQSHPGCRQASCIWVLSVLKSCKYKPAIQKHLHKIQNTFMNFLGDNNEMIQDAASKGLGVVYECCSESTRQAMVESLVQTLAVGRKKTTEVNKDTKIFEEGELGSAPSGGQLSTYRELCSLAADLNQPDLIYKFMNLASHNAIWTSKKGAAFGFNTLASQAGAQLEPYLPQIIPKLYRYQHDPTPKIQQPMQSIWNSLITDTKNAINKYYDSILSDIVSNMTNSVWRVRESSCNALTDLLRREPVTRAVEQIEEIWNLLFRVRDDIKESVRNSAEKTLQALSSKCIKACQNRITKSEDIMLHTFPILLTNGITSTVVEVRDISLTTIVQLCRCDGAMVKPHLKTLLPAMLEALSGLEHKALSYTAVRVDDEDREKLDQARVNASKSTRMMDTINYVLQFVDESVIDSVVSGVIETLKKSVGLSSKAGAAHVIETLTYTCPEPLEKHAGKILAAMVNGLSDRNVVIRKTYASAIGKLVKTSKASSIDKLMAKFHSWYLDKDDECLKASAAITLQKIYRQNADIMKDHSSQALPLVFLAMHGVSEDPQTEIWKEVWDEGTSSTETAVKMHFSEILNICETALSNNSWAIKAQAGRAMSTVAEKAGSTVTHSHLLKVTNLLISALQGRTWTGKEFVITALADFSLKFASDMRDVRQESGSALLDDVIKVLIREASKDKLQYKIFALKSLTKVLHSYKLDRFEEVFNICLPQLSVDYFTSNADKDEEKYSEESKQKWVLIDEIICSLGRAWPSNQNTQEQFSEKVIEMLSESINRVPKNTQLTVVKALQNFWKEHFFIDGLPQTLDHSLLGCLIYNSCKIFNFTISINKYYSLREESLILLCDMLQRIKGYPDLVRRFQTELQSTLEEAKRSGQKELQPLISSALKSVMMES